MIDEPSLASPDSYSRAARAYEAGENESRYFDKELHALLTDTSPFVWGRWENATIGEVRFNALTALQKIFRSRMAPLELGVVTVRAVMPVQEAVSRYESLSDDDRRGVANVVETALRERVQPSPEDESALRAYLTLQALGLIEYRQEEIDPKTYATPLQEELRRNQIAEVNPPIPHLRVADLDDGTRTFGFVYRNGARWCIALAEAIGTRYARWFLTDFLARGTMKRACVENGQTVRNPDQTVKFEGTVDINSGDQIDVLETMRAYLERRYTVEIVTA